MNHMAQTQDMTRKVSKIILRRLVFTGLALTLLAVMGVLVREVGMRAVHVRQAHLEAWRVVLAEDLAVQVRVLKRDQPMLIQDIGGLVPSVRSSTPFLSYFSAAAQAALGENAEVTTGELLSGMTQQEAVREASFTIRGPAARGEVGVLLQNLRELPFLVTVKSVEITNIDREKESTTVLISGKFFLRS